MSKTIPSRFPALAAGLCLTAAVFAENPQPPDPQVLNNPAISRAVVAAGGQASNGGYVLHGAIGQPLTGTSTGGGYQLDSGYHSFDDLIFRHDMDQ